MIAFVGKTLTLTGREEGAGGPTIARSLSCARSFAIYVGECALTGLKREGQQTRKSGRRDLLKWTSFVCFFAALQDGGLLEMGYFSSWCRWWYLWQTLLDHHISHFLCEVQCLFFGGLFVFSALPHCLKKNWTRNIKNKRHALMYCPISHFCFFLSLVFY